MNKIYTARSILSLNIEYTYTDYISISLNVTIDKLSFLECDGLKIHRTKLMIGKNGVDFNNYRVFNALHVALDDDKKTKCSF